jgi:hypothetical protein
MPTLAGYPGMMQRARKREGLRVCRAAWLVENEATLDELFAFRVHLSDLAEEGYLLIKWAADAAWPRTDGQPRT